MARPLRNDFEPGVHHVFARGNRRQAIFLDDGDRVRYLALLGNVVDDRLWRCLAYCLMDNHVHLLVETREPNLADGMRYLHGVYAQGFNERHRFEGHLFQGRYGSNRMASDAQLLQTARYIARNPLEAGLCRHPAEYGWCSHAALVGEHGVPGWLDRARLLAYVGAGGGDPVRRYRQLVESDGATTGGAAMA